jgi:hypothetical protein
MELNFKPNRKKTKNVGMSLNMNNATKTFKRLIEKHKKEMKVDKKIYSNKIDDFFSTLNNAFFQKEIKETDSDYIYKEIKNQIKISQNLVDLYGVNATTKVYKHPREPIKYDKQLVFNPLNDSGQNKIKYTSYFNDSKNKKGRKLDLPCIIKKNIKIGSSPKQSSLKTMVFEDYNNNEDKKKYHFIKLNKYNNNHYNDNYRNLTVGNERYVPKKSDNYLSKTNDDLLNLKRNVNYNNNTFSSSNQINDNTKSSFDKKEYVMNLDSLNDQMRITQRKHRRYFNSNDYGCTLSKNKYNYITKYFFN